MKKALVIVLLVMMALSGTAFAGDNPVTLDSSSVEDGAADVPVDASITLVFTNNVVNKKIADNNKSCITLSGGGQDVALDFEMADDQIEPDKKRDIIVSPAEPLAEGTKYTLTISKELTGKNGIPLGEDIAITFTTEGAAAAGFAFWWIIVIAAVVVGAGVALILLKKKSASKA